MKITKILFLILVFVVALSLLVGCTPAAPSEVTSEEVAEEEAPPEEEVAKEEAPPEEEVAKEELTLVYVTPSLGLTLDPSYVFGGPTAEIVESVYASWIEYDLVEGFQGIMAADTGGGEKTMQPAVFESWEISEEGKVYTMHIREDIIDSYGNQFKAEDAKWIFDRMRGTEAGSVYIVENLNLKDPDQVTVVDEYTLEFRLPAPNPVFLRVLNVNNAMPFGAATARQHATDDDPWATEWLATNAPATGPYMVESWTAGVEQVLVKNPNYFGPEPAYDRIIYRQVPESANRVALIINGDADIARDLTVDEITRIQEEAGINAMCYPGNQFVWAPMNYDMEPTSNPKVREALAYAVPYEDILSVYGGNAKPLYGWITDGFSDFLGGDAFPYETDLEKAKDLLVEAGFPDGFDLEISISTAFAEHERIAVLLQNSFSKIGVNLTIDTKPMAAYRDKTLSRQAQIAIEQDFSFVLDPNYAAMLWLAPCEPPCHNTSGFTNSEFEDLRGGAVEDGPERSTQLQRMQEIFYEETPWLSLANIPTCFAMSESVEGYVWYPHNQIEYGALQPHE